MSAVEESKAAKDWRWWLESPHARTATVEECVHEAQAYIAELRATIERLQKMAGCPHYSATGIDTTPNDSPMKVWQCDECGFRYREVWEPELGLRYNEGVWE